MRTTILPLLLASGCYTGLELEATDDDAGSTTATTGNDDGPGQNDESLAICQPGAWYTCYDGPPGTADVGLCLTGRRRCELGGQAFGACLDAVLPVAEDCNTGDDDDCDGSSTCGGLQRIFVHSGARLHDLAPGSDRVVLLWTDDQGAHLTALSTTGAPDHTVDLGRGLSSADRLLLAQNPATGAVTVGATLIDTFDPALNRPYDCSISAGKGDVLLARFDADLLLTASRCWGDAADQRLTALDVPPDGAPRIAGLFHGTLAFADPPLTAPGVGYHSFFAQLDPTLGAAAWSRGFDAASDSLELPSIVATTDGAVAIGTVRGGPDALGGSDVFVTRHIAAGDSLWTRRFGNAKDQIARAVAVAPDGSVWIAGDSQGYVDLGDGPFADDTTLLTFVARLDAATGEPVAPRQIPGLVAATSRALAVDAQADLTLLGTSSSAMLLDDLPLPSGGDDDVVLIKLAPTGAVRWARRLGDDSPQVARTVRLDARGDVLVGGEFSGLLTDGNIHVQTDTPQLFILQYLP